MSSDSLLKKKYAELVAESDRKAHEWQDTEKLLCRTIIRLTLATDGLDSALDPHLKKLRTLLKAGIKSDRLKSEVDAVSDALLRSGEGDEDPAPQFDASFLFEFLGFCAVSQEEKSAIERLSSEYANGDFSGRQALFESVRKTLGPIEQSNDEKVGLLARLFGKGKKEPISTDESNGPFRQELLKRLLDSLDIPAYLQHQYVQLQKQTNNTNGDVSEFFTILEDIIALLLAVKEKIKEEQKEIDRFLSDMASRLEELGVGAESVKEFFDSSSASREKFGREVSEEISQLEKESHEATSLDDLKGSVKNRLDTFASQLKSHLENEQKRADEAESKIDDLEKTISSLEAESENMHSSIRLKHDLAFRDALTGLPNRLAYEERISIDFARWKRFKDPLTLIVWDVDLFKQINDRFGHQAGDVALRAIAKVLSDGVRETDFVGRYGGEEFVMLLSGVTKEVALKKAEMIRESVKTCGFNSKGNPVEVTISCGISQFVEGDEPEQVFDRADNALYRAKNTGRDQCIIA